MNGPRAVLKVLIVDDHDIVRLGVRHLLAGHATIVEAATLVEARTCLGREPFDLLLLDLGLGDEFGLAALPALRREWPALKIIVLTSMGEDLYAERALRAGADGFVMKTSLQGTLLEAFEAVMAGAVYVSPRLSGKLLRRAVAGPWATDDDVRGKLSMREIEVLRLVAAGRSTRDIAETLNRSVKTIETHKQSLKTKLGADSPAMLMRLALAWRGDGA